MRIEDLESLEIVYNINNLYGEFHSLSNDEIRTKINKIEKKLSVNNSQLQLNEVLPSIFALVKEVARRFTVGDIEVTASEMDKKFSERYDFIKINDDKAIYYNQWRVLNEDIKWDMIHYDEQILAGIYLHQGKAIEMATGEGKTLAATMPIILNGLTHKGVHVMTVNDYLSKRDCELMRPLYTFFGLSVDCLEYTSGHNIIRKYCYQSDVVFGTISTFTFDYLFDHLSTSPDNCVQTSHYYTIIDELDSTLIDEAQTPHRISGEKSSDIANYYNKNKSVIEELLKDNTLYVVDKSNNKCSFTDKGKEWIANKCGISDLFKVGKFERNNIHLNNLSQEEIEISKKLEIQNVFHQLLYAYTLIEKDVDYIVSPNREILIVDQNTGRIKPGYRWSFGRHSAVEVKEGVNIKPDNTIEAVISLKNYFCLYNKISGMSGTLLSCAEELKDMYGLDVRIIPTHRKMIRKDEPIRIFKTREQKYYAIRETIRYYYKIGQPILIGCLNIKEAEKLHKMLYDDNINANLLTAKTLEKEAYYISLAGQNNAVTIATSIAGRGTDIKLSKQSKENGGLVVIGVDLFKSVRVDKQLMGRAGRQGDPGTSVFFISLDDNIFEYLNKEDKEILESISKHSNSDELDNEEIRGIITKLQDIQEEDYKSGRKETARKDDIIAPFRKKFYDFRNKVLFNASYANKLITEIIIDNDSVSLADIDKHLELLYVRVQKLLRLYSINNHSKLEFSIPFSDATHLFVVNLNVDKALNDYVYFKNEYKRQVILNVYDKYWKRFIAYANSQLDKSEIERLPVNFESMRTDIYNIILSRLTHAIIPIGILQEDRQENSISINTDIEETEHKFLQNDDICPCGSGKKYYECHGENTRNKKRRY